MNSMPTNCLANVLIYLQQFPSYSNRKCKKSPFSRTAAHSFVSPGDAPAAMTKNVASMERQFNACQTPRSMYLSIFNSFRVIRFFSQCVSPKIAIFTFLQVDRKCDGHTHRQTDRHKHAGKFILCPCTALDRQIRGKNVMRLTLMG